MRKTLQGDARLEEIRRLADLERDLVRQTVDVRAQFAELVSRLLPSTAPAESVRAVVEASGHRKEFIDALRFKEHPWQRPASAAVRRDQAGEGGSSP